MGDSRTTGSKRPDDKKKKASRSPRNTLLYIGSVVILILVVVTFVGVPAVGGIAQPSGSIVFGRYGGEDIAYRPGNFFARQYEMIAQSLRDSAGDLELELQLRLAWRQAFNRTVMRTALLQQADRSNVRVSEARVDELIAQDPRFQTNGRFDRTAFSSISNQERFSLRNFHQESEAFNLFVDDVLYGSVSPEGEGRFVASMAGPERSFDIVRFPFDAFPQDQVQAYARENSELFTELNLSVVTLASREEAERIRAQAQEPGNPFAELARTYSRDLYGDQGGEIGRIWGYEVQQELLNPDDLERLTTLPAGSLSELVETTSGWSFFLAEDDPQPFDASREETIREARSYMQSFEQGRIQDFVRREAETFRDATDVENITAAAETAGYSVHETPYFPINYGNQQLFTRVNIPDIPDIQDATFRESFFVTAFSLEENQISQPVMLQRSAILLVLRDEREVDAESTEFLRSYYDSIRAQFQSDEIEFAYIDEDRLEDNFLPAFNRYVLGQR